MESLNEEQAGKLTPWTDIEEILQRDTDVDALLYNTVEELAIQVTRPDFGGLWWAIGNGTTVATSHDVVQAADEIKSAIEKKRLVPRTAPDTQLDRLRKKREQRVGKRSRRGGLVLAIDCIETPALVLNSGVAAHFNRTHGDWARKIGFSAIWLVGATATLTRQLIDNPSD